MNTAKRRAQVSLGVRFAAIVALAALGIVAGCGGDRLSREELGGRLASVDERGGEHWGRLAQRAGELRPGQPIPADVEQPLHELVEFQRKAARELQDLTPPQGAADEVEALIGALRGRTRAFEQAVEAGMFTSRMFERITRWGERIDAAFERLRAEGYLPTRKAGHDG